MASGQCGCISRCGVCGGAGVIPAQLGTLDAFPNQHRPRVLIVRIEDLYRLDPGYSRGANSGMTDRKPFTPHVTLGRVKQDGMRVHGLETPVKPVVFEVSEVVLFASELLPQGPRHTPLIRVAL